ncbi:MAG: peptidase M13, partial [Acidobacteria bacterium]|nr:peptidase M13 [Acidobacteriota bacterium]
TEFKTRAGSLSAQYSGYEPIAGLKVNGDLTLGENIGDLGGLTVALTAYHKSLSGQPAPVMDGFTGDQRVFLGWAQVWRIKYREDALRQRIMTDPHSPGEFRVLGVMPNIDGFYSAFDVKEGDKMYIAPEKRVRIW